MSFGFVAAGVGAAAAVGGSYISAKSNEKIANQAAQAAQFSPFAINTGNVSSGAQIDPETGEPIAGTFQGELTAPLATAQQQANLGVLGGLQRGGVGIGSDIGFQDARFQQGTRFAGAGAQGFGQQAFDQNRLLAGQQGQLGQALGQFQQQQAGAFNQLGGISNFAAQRGAGLLGQDTGQVRENELALLRQQARPAEDRAVNAKFQNLFSRGQLGTTGGHSRRLRRTRTSVAS
jgi:hypothetical protein